jgi:hypothetical protein
MIAEPEPEEAPACIVCMEISITVTDCDHPLCRDCYKKMVELPAHQRNMKRCPYCRKEAPALKNEFIELTDEQKLQHYTVLLDYYTANTVCQNIPPPPVVHVYHPVVHVVHPPPPQIIHRDPRIVPRQVPRQVPPQVPPQVPEQDREWFRGNRILLVDGLDLEEARVRVIMTLALQHNLIQLVCDNPRRIGFEIAGALNTRNDRIKLSRMNRFIIRRNTRELDIHLINITYTAQCPAHTRTHINMYEGCRLSRIPFNGRPLAPCSCGRKTRRCCSHCGEDYTCNTCDQCRTCIHDEDRRPLPPRFYTITPN